MKKYPNYLEHWRFILAIVPHYRSATESVTRVYYVDGTMEEYPCRCEVIVKHLATLFRTSLPVARKRASHFLGRNRSRKVPLVLYDGFCLVPFKYREKIRHNDSTVGYAVSQYVDSTVPFPDGGCRILFKKTWCTLLVRQNKITVDAQLAEAVHLQACFDDETSRWEHATCFARDTISNKEY